MNRSSDSPLARRRPGFAAAVLGILLCAGSAAGQLSLVPAPVPSPDGDTSFVGSVRVVFPELSASQRGKIYYTTDGSTPGALLGTAVNGTEYDYGQPIVLAATTTLKAIRLRSALWSEVHTARFIKRKLPSPRIAFEGSASFTGTKRVTLSLPGITPLPEPAPVILYSTDASAPDSVYPAAGLTLSKTCVLKVSATHAEYDPSPVASASFTLLQPAARPTLSPNVDVFQTKTLAVVFRSETPGAFFQWSLGPGSNPDSGTIGDTAVLVGSYPGEVIVLRVVAKRTQPLMANSPVVEHSYTYLPPPEPPTANPAPGGFYDVAIVELKTPTQGTVIHYTLDGVTMPTPSRPMYDPVAKLSLDSTVTLKAVAFQGSAFSSTFQGTYILNLSAPVASHPSQEYVDSISVTLSARSPTAQIVYTVNGNEPTGQSAQYLPGEVITIKDRDTLILKAMAIKGSVKSQVSTYQYLRKAVIRTTKAPTLDPAGRDFQDSQTVAITAEPGAAITYSLDGGAYLPYTVPLKLKATAVLRAVARKPELSASEARTETYVLIPSPPLADNPAGEYPNRVTVSLTPRTPGSQVLYSLEGGNFVLDLAEPFTKPLVFTAGTAAVTHTLRAVAVLGTDAFKRMSPVLTLNYTVYPSNQSDSLAPGQQRDLTLGVAVSNKGSSTIFAKLGSVDPAGLAGFQDATYSVSLSAANGQAALSAAFIRGAGQSQSVYRVTPSGRFEFVGTGAQVNVSRPGVYLAAKDTLPPDLTLKEQAPVAGDSTRVVLALRDNVAGAACVVTGSGLDPAGTPMIPDAEGNLRFHLKNPYGGLKSLWFRALASDAVNQTALPASGNAFSVVQGWPALDSPPIWKLGLSAEQPYDLVGLPIGKSSQLTWKQIRDDNQDPTLTAHLFRNGGYQPVEDTMRMAPGMAFWLGSRNPNRKFLKLSQFQTPGSDADGRFRVHLKRGWNLITNPSLDVMHWPVRHDSPDYSEKRVRGLWEYSHPVMDHIRTDSLIPWRGYWVLNLESADQTVELLPAPAPALKAAAGPDPSRVEILLDYGRPAGIRLGARNHARDSIGIEDEPTLPPAFSARPGRQRRNGWSDRDGNRLMTDLLRLSGEVLRWTVILEGAPMDGRDSLVRVQESQLPTGYEAWAWSKRRNLKVRLEAGATYSLPGHERDTLQVLAGPAAKLAALPELARAVESVAAFSSRTVDGRNGPRLLLALPTDAQVEAALWSTAGRRLAVLHSGRLGSGEHSLAISRPGATRQIVILRLTVKGPAWRQVRSHRIAL